MNRLAKWLYSVGFFLAMCTLLAAGTYQYKDNLSIPYNINLFTCGSASCTSMVLQNSSGTELFNGANPGAVLATIQNILVSPISVGIASGSSPVGVTIPSPIGVTGSFTATLSSPAAMNLVQVQNQNIASPQTYGIAPVGSVEGVNAFVTNNVNVTPPTPLGVTLPASPVSVGVTNSPTVVLSGSPVSVGIAAGSSPINVTGSLTANSSSPTTINLEQIQNVNVASPSTYGAAPVGSVQGVNAFVTNNVNVTPPTPLNVTVGTFASPQGVAVVNNVAVTTPTPLGVTLPASPLSVGIAGPTPLAVTLPASPISVGIAGPTPLNVTIATGTNITQIAGNNIASPTGYGTAPVGSVLGVNAFVTNNVSVTPPTPLNVTVGGIVSPQNVTFSSPTSVVIGGPTPLAVTLPASPTSVAIAGPTPLNVTVGGIVSPQNVTLAASPLSVTVTPIGLAITVANPASVTTAYVATTAFAVTASVVALGATPGIVGNHQLTNVGCIARSPIATPPAAYVQIFDATPHATGSDVTLGTTNPTMFVAVSGSPVSQNQALSMPPPGLQFNHGIAVAATTGLFKSATALGISIDCSFGYN